MVEIVRGAEDLTVSVSVLLAELPLPSVTLATKLNTPAVEGVPEIVPDWPNEIPGGKEPVSINHEKSGLPPTAVSVRP